MTKKTVASSTPTSKKQKKTKQEGIKTFILDTNIPLTDPSCLTGFKEHNVCIPIVVLEELDNFKKGNETVNVNAREFGRRLKQLAGDELFNSGLSLGKNLGKLTIALGVDYPKEMEQSFSEDTPDHRILAIALTKKQQGENVILVTNDLNLQMKARALGVLSESYRNDSVKDMSKIYESILEISLTEKEWVNICSTKEDAYPIPSRLKDYPANQLFIFTADEKMLVRKTPNWMIPIRKNEKVFGIQAKNHEQEFAFDALLDPQISLIALTGKAGTGKTLLAIAAALKQKEQFEGILVARPAVEMSDKTLGFLPGDKDEKIDPYMMPIYDNLAVIRESGKPKQRTTEPIREWAKANKIQVLVLNYIRGRSLADRFIIIDEAQNLTPHEVKTIITRAGEGTKIVIIGDVSQIDSPYQNERSNGLSYLIDKWLGQPEFVHVHLTQGERSPLADKAGRIMWVNFSKNSFSQIAKRVFCNYRKYHYPYFLPFNSGGKCSWSTFAHGKSWAYW